VKLLVDTSVIIDVLRGRPEATDALVAARATAGPLHASEITRAEIIAGMRADGKTISERHEFGDVGRGEVRQKSVAAALSILKRLLE